MITPRTGQLLAKQCAVDTACAGLQRTDRVADAHWDMTVDMRGLQKVETHTMANSDTEHMLMKVPSIV